VERLLSPTIRPRAGNDPTRAAAPGLKYSPRNYFGWAKRSLQAIEDVIVQAEGKLAGIDPDAL